MPTGGTIAAIGTPPGHSTRAIIRISGDDAQSCVSALTSLTTPARGVHSTRIKLGKTHTIPCTLLWFDGPRSYTGQDVAEFMVVGSPEVLDRLLNQVLWVPGVRRAEPGEFSARAYLNNRLTLAQAEGVALRISATSQHALDAAASLLDGSQGHRCQQWAQELATLLALVESGVDFTDQEDVVPITPDDLGDRLSNLKAQLAGEISSSSGSVIHRSIPEVVICGQPNAGKSALFNALLNTRRAVVSDQPGTTRDAISEELNLEHEIPGSGSVYLTDLAGMGDHAIDSLDAAAQRLARSQIESSDAIIWCDPSGRFVDTDGFETLGKPIIRVRTKSDLPVNHSTQGIGVCALDGHHIGMLKRAIADSTVDHAQLGTGAFVPRHRHAICRAVIGIDAALHWIHPGAHSLDAPELVASGLRDGLDALGELTGQITPDDVLGRVFSTFCVGK